MVRKCRLCGEEKSGDSFSTRRESGRKRTECNQCRSNSSTAARYGTTIGAIESLAEKQGHSCAICGTHKDSISHSAFKHNPLVIDHCHSTGRVRGLLCPTCNLLLGHAKDDVALLAKAVAYLAAPH